MPPVVCANPPRRMHTLLNDVHSRLNPTRVAQVLRPVSVAEVQAAVTFARREGLCITVGGSRHAMGGQQFGPDTLHLDMRALNGVVSHDASRGLLHMGAGADWQAVVRASHSIPGPQGRRWGIRQKQTGVDEVSLGGSIAANAHGRGLCMQPLGEDIESLTLVDAQGQLRHCSRTQEPELFSLVVGGYGLFGIVCSATLRLAPRQRVRRVVDILDLEEAQAAIERRVAQGCLYGDFQFAIDPQDPGFLQRGVLACYLPVAGAEAGGLGEAADVDASEPQAELGPEAWLQLLKLAHEDKAGAFRRYAQHYLSTHGQTYWHDTMQLSTYIPSYSEFLANAGGRSPDRPDESLVIGEHYVPPQQLTVFMARAAQVLRAHGTELIYGTIRAIRRDTTSWLPWAREDSACVIFNLRTPHTPAGLQGTADTFRALVDLAIELGGSFFLTYHRHATVAQVQACYPRFAEWLALKQQHDPEGLFTSSWYAHYRQAFADASPPSPGRP